MWWLVYAYRVIGLAGPETKRSNRGEVMVKCMMTLLDSAAELEA